MNDRIQNASRIRANRWLALICVLLLALASSVEAAHLHLNQSANNQRCSFCLAVHGNAAAPASTQFRVTAPEFTSRLLPTEDCTAKLRLCDGALYVRPPPAI